MLVALVASRPWPVPSALGRVPLCASVHPVCSSVPVGALANPVYLCFDPAFSLESVTVHAFMSWVVQVQNIRFYFRYLKTALSISYLAF